VLGSSLKFFWVHVKHIEPNSKYGSLESACFVVLAARDLCEQKGHQYLSPEGLSPYHPIQSEPIPYSTFHSFTLTHHFAFACCDCCVLRVFRVLCQWESKLTSVASCLSLAFCYRLLIDICVFFTRFPSSLLCPNSPANQIHRLHTNI